MEEHDAAALAGLLHGAGRRLFAQHRLLCRRQPSVLDALLRRFAGPSSVEQGSLRPWAESMIRAYWACGGHMDAPMARDDLVTAVAAFAACMGALEIFDDLVDGDEPDGGQQAPNLALAFIGESTALLARLSPPRAAPLIAAWGDLWMRCAAAQARDVALSGRRDLTVEQAVAVAEGCGLFTRWPIEAGALLAGPADNVRAPLMEFGQHLGTAEKLLHDIHDLWPGERSSHDLHRPTCNLALAVVRKHCILTIGRDGAAFDDDTLRRHIHESGALHYAWAYADQYRLRAADALDRFARAGGDPAPLVPLLALSPELRAARLDDSDAPIAFAAPVP